MSKTELKSRSISF